MRRLSRVLLLAMPILAFTLAAPGLAVDLIVTRYDDPVPGGCDNLGPHATWDCSLREAVVASVALGTDDRILLSAGRYELTRAGVDEDEGLTGDLDIVGNLEILGPGATMTVIDGNGLDRIFDINDDTGGGTDAIRIAGVTLTGGAAPTGGGQAIEVTRVDLTIERCELVGNGAILDNTLDVAIFSSLTLRESTIRDNPGGGVTLSQSSGVLINTTISNNGDTELTVSSGATVLCQHCTIRDDEAAAEVEATGDLTVLQLASSVVIGDCALSPGGDIDSLGGNLESPGATCGLGAGDLENVASHGLGSLAANGGPTFTHVPGVTSPVLGLATALFCAPTDQRGITRDEASCDAGAVERAIARPPIPIFADGFLQGDADAWSSVL